MAIFAVLADKANPSLGKKIADLFPTDHYNISDSQWLISADTISQALAEQLEVRAGQYGRVVVLRASTSASGYHSKTLWEWIKQKAAYDA